MSSNNNKDASDEHDDWGEGDALTTEAGATEIAQTVPPNSAGGRSTSITTVSSTTSGTSMSSDSRAQQLQAKMEREAALRSARMSHGSAARTATTAGGGSDDVRALSASQSQSQRVISPDERLAAKIAAEDATSAGAGGSLSPTGTLGSISEASSSSPVESPEDRMAAKIRREAANSASTERSDAIQARTRAEQRRAEASYSAGSGSALGRSMPAATPGVTYVSARSSAATAAVVGESAADESTPEDRLQSKLRESCVAEESTPEDRLQSKLRESCVAEESTPEDRLQSKLRESCVAEESTPEDRLQGKLQQSAAEESTPGNRLQSKLRGESVRGEGASFSPSSTMTPESRLVAKIQRDSTQTSGVAGAPAAGGSVGKSHPAAVGGVGAVAVRGSLAEEYEDGSRRSRYVDNEMSTVIPEHGGDSGDPPPQPENADVAAFRAREKRIFGMTKQMMVIAGAALLVIVVAAAAGGAAAAAGGNSSSPEGSPPAIPSMAPTISPTTPAPTKFLPPECQLNMLPNEFDPDDQFGSSVAVSGDTAIVGAPASESAAGGSVHIFERSDGTNWAKSSVVLTPSDSFDGDEFGRSLDIHNGVIVVGARMNHVSPDFGDTILQGCVYIFVRQLDGTWLEEARLLSDDPDSSDVYFASAVALHEGTLVVGEPRNRYLPAGAQTGTIYIFERIGDADWVQRAKFRPEDGSLGDRFGVAVDVYQNTAVVGAPLHDTSDRIRSGAAYVFTKTEFKDRWAQDSKLLPGDGAGSDFFGQSVAISLDVIVVGASGDDDNGSSSGSAYVFVDNNGQWAEATKLVAEDGEASDSFGKAVDADEDLIVIGAEGADHDRDSIGLANVGAVYVFERVEASVWIQASRLQPPGGDKNDEFGSSVAADGGTVVCGSYSGTPYDTGKAYVVEVC